jgi:hypothetical protein
MVIGTLMEHDRSARTIPISQGPFIDSILTRLNAARPRSRAPGTHLSAEDCPTSKDEKDMMVMKCWR